MCIYGFSLFSSRLSSFEDCIFKESPEELLDFFGREDSSGERSGVTPEPTADPISVASPWKHSVQRLMAPR